MNHQEKAKELINKFSSLVTTWDCYFDSPRNPDHIKDDAKKCAVILVEEIISAIETTTGHCTLRKLDYQEVQQDFQYWNRVKEEIQKL